MKNFILILLLFSEFISAAQERDINQYSIDINYGLSLPVAPILESRKASDFTGFNTIVVGVRYMISPKIGFKVSYSHIGFQDKN